MNSLLKVCTSAGFADIFVLRCCEELERQAEPNALVAGRCLHLSRKSYQKRVEEAQQAHSRPHTALAPLIWGLHAHSLTIEAHLSNCYLTAWSTTRSAGDHKLYVRHTYLQLRSKKFVRNERCGATVSTCSVSCCL
jgi:hypothetical protein